MRSLLSKSIAIAAISLASFPSLAMDSVAVERFQSQNQTPLSLGHEDASGTGLKKVAEASSESHKEGLRKVETRHNDSLPRNVGNQSGATDK
ncbi:hypothetical protein [Modicisalibacter sp. 'Wilcox']|uniref:hypothetical protein n=1 Tax=Modicisalibacter sp. 'Wilcox' TaxID=2679914 RepID=UPI0013D6AD5C|nr:hypothetical protein [Modicisalibacter sp. 'Wilcox']